jgi:hydrogenase nickel incorporation protein HypA/HybF
MHELSMAESVVALVNELAQKNDFKNVQRIRLAVGAMSGVVRESLEFCFSLVVEGTILENAIIEMIDVPLKVRCHDCGETSTAMVDMIVCGACGSFHVQVTDGRDLKVIDLEVEPCAKTADVK